MIAERKVARPRKTTPRRAAGGRPAAKPGRRSAVPARTRAGSSDRLAAGVLDLKRASDQTAARFAARVGDELGEVLRTLGGEERVPKPVVKAMLAQLRAVRLKPEKGRLKDLARIHDLAEELLGMLQKP